MAMSARRYILDRVEFDGETLCWEWQLGRTGPGYGIIKSRQYGNPRPMAHRLAWESFRGEITPGMWVLHHCDNRMCCNPDHLYLGTAKDNARDTKERHPRGIGIQKLTRSQALCIKSDNRHANTVAQQYGVSRHTIRDIKTGRTWPELSREGNKT